MKFAFADKSTSPVTNLSDPRNNKKQATFNMTRDCYGNSNTNFDESRSTVTYKFQRRLIFVHAEIIGQSSFAFFTPRVRRTKKCFVSCQPTLTRNVLLACIAVIAIFKLLFKFIKNLIEWCIYGSLQNYPYCKMD